MSQVAVSTQPAYFKFASGLEFKLGIAAAIFTTLIWSGFFIAMRAGVTSPLTAFDLAILRFGLAAVLLLPFTIRAWSTIIATPKMLLLGILAGAGVPFFFLCSIGITYAPASHAGLLVTGTSPLFIAIAAVVVFKEKLNKQKVIGLASIGLGVAALLSLAFWDGNSEYLKGDLIILLAAACWAMFSICLRVACLPPLAIAGFLSLVSTFILATLYIAGAVESGFTVAPAKHIAMQIAIQSVCVGLLAAFSYGYAINKVGAERSSAIGSLTPVLVGLMAIPLLGETLTVSATSGMVLVFLGVLLSSGIKVATILPFNWRRREQA